MRYRGQIQDVWLACAVEHTRSEKEAVAGAECRVTRAEETRRASCAREAWSRGRVITIEIWQPID